MNHNTNLEDIVSNHTYKYVFWENKRTRIAYKWWPLMIPNQDESTLQVLKIEYSRITRPWPWLLMPWLLVSTRNNFNCLCHLTHWGPRQNGRNFPDVFKCIFFDKNVWISIRISLKFVPKGPINSIPVLVEIMAWCWPGNKPLSEPIMVSLLPHICVTLPQWVKHSWILKNFNIFCVFLKEQSTQFNSLSPSDAYMYW